MEVFRVEKTDRYTVISNEHIFDPNLTNKAKGLMTILLALPNTWNFNVNGFTKLSKDGRDSIMGQLSELEKAGYLSKKKIRNEKGQIVKTEYTIYESKSLNPCYTNSKTSSENDLHADDNNDITDSNIARNKPISNKMDEQKNGLNTDLLPKSGNPTTEKPIMVKPKSGNPTTDIPITVNPTLENPYTEYPLQSNTNQSNTIVSSNNQSIHQIDAIDFPDNDYRSIVARQISYDEIMEQLEYQEKYPNEAKIINCSKDFYITAYELICEVMQNKSKTMTIGGVKLKTAEVKEMLLRNDEETIAYVYSNMMQRGKSEPIKNIKAYLLVALYNAPRTMSVQLESELAQAGYK